MSTIAFFDFDGTITRGDSFALFLKFLLRKRFYIKVIQNLPLLLLYKFHILDNHTVKQYILQSCIKGMEWEYLRKKCYEFRDVLEAYCKQSALQRIQWHKENNHTVVLVSASFEEYLRPLCEKWQIELLATTMEIRNGIMTGKFSQPNCYGIQKEKRIKAVYNLNDYESIYAYGDTRGDKEMLALASTNQAFFRIFE